MEVLISLYPQPWLLVVNLGAIRKASLSIQFHLFLLYDFIEGYVNNPTPWLGPGHKIMNNKTLVSKSDIFSLRDTCTSSQQFSREGGKKCSRGRSGDQNQADHIILCVRANFLKEEMLNDEHLWNKVKGRGERRDSGHTDYLKDPREQEKKVI